MVAASYATPRRTDRPGTRLAPFALLLVLSLPALLPLLTTSPTRSADGLLHLYRLVQLDALWRSGVFFSRWLPDLLYGYGLPLFSYYAPLVYYLTTPLTALGIPFTLALNLSLAAALFVGAVGMFLLTRELLRGMVDEMTRALAALVAAVAFLYAPYLLFNAFQRGNLAEQWALALAPFAFWRFVVLASKPNALNWVFAVFAFAAVMLAHNVTSILVAPLLIVFALVSVFANRVQSSSSRRALLVSLSALVVALGLSAFFWLPALLERDFVQIARVIVTPDFDYRFNFVSPLELVSLLPRADTGRMNPALPATLGLVQAVLGAVGAVWLVMRFRSRAALPLYLLGAAALVFTGLMLAVSQPIWDSVSLLSFVQLPMRIRGLVALCFAPFVGIAIAALPGQSRVLGACVVVGVLVLSAFPLLYPRYARDVPSTPTLADMFKYEQQTGVIGTTSFGEYLPVWVQNPPDETPFGEAYTRNEAPERFVVPEGVQICGQSGLPTDRTLCTTSATPWRAVYRALYVPGWRAEVNGAEVPIEPTARTGLISFEVPGTGTVRVMYAGTQVERIAEWISLACAVVVLGVLASGVMAVFRRAEREAVTVRAESSRGAAASQVLSPALRVFIPLFVVALALLAFKFVYVDRVSNPLVAHYDRRTVEGVSTVRPANFGDELELVGFDPDAASIKRGETLRPILYWRALPGMQRDLSTFVHLTAPDGFVLAQKDSLHPAAIPTSKWDAEGYAADEHAFQVPPTLAPGEYELRAGVYDPRTNTRLATSDGDDFVLLGILTVTE